MYEVEDGGQQRTAVFGEVDDLRNVVVFGEVHQVCLHQRLFEGGGELAGLPGKAIPDALKALGYRHQPGEGGGTFLAAPENRRARHREGAAQAANPCSPFARLKSLTARP